MGDQAKKELKELGKKYDKMKADLEKRLELQQSLIDDIKEDIKNNPDKTSRDELKHELQTYKEELKELQIKIEETEYIKLGYVLKDGKWVKPEEKKEEPPKTPEEIDPPEKEEEPKKESGWFL